MTNPKGTKRPRSEDITGVPNNGSEDLVLLCPTKPGEPMIPFKLQARRLAAMSNVFDSMLQDAKPTEQFEGLPVILVPETATIMSYFLAPVYNSPLHKKLLTSDKSGWDLLLGVWEAANKYEAFHMRAQASNCLCRRLYTRTSDPSALLDLCLRAELFNDEVLADAVCIAAQTVAWSDLPKDKLRQLSFDRLHLLTTKSFSWTAAQLVQIEQSIEEAEDSSALAFDENIPAHTLDHLRYAAENLADLRRHLSDSHTETSPDP